MKIYGKRKMLYRVSVEDDRLIVNVYHSNRNCIRFIRRKLNDIPGILQYYRKHYHEIEKFKNSGCASECQFVSQAHSYLGIIVLFDYVSYFEQGKVEFRFHSSSPSKDLFRSALDLSGGKQHSKVYHDERCRRCKETIKKLLEKIYGEVKKSYKFEIEPRPEAFRNTSYYEVLKKNL